MNEFDFQPLHRIGFNLQVARRLAAAQPTEPGCRLMRIVEAQRYVYTLHDGLAVHRARALGGLISTLQRSDAMLTVGDWVIVQADAHGALWFVARLAPVNRISRRANDGQRQALVSNVDTALLTMGLDADFNPRRLERAIAMVAACGVTPVVVLTKADLGEDVEAKLAALRERLPGQLPIHAVNALDPADCAALAPWLTPGQTLVLLGASGTGKSTLANSLVGAPLQATGSVRRSDGRGQHTTTTRSLHCLPGGACLIDTPGLRTWQPDADAASLAASFEDIAELATQCRFRDCRHEAEPGCAVRAAVPPDRLQNYGKLLRDAERGERTPQDRIAQRAVWKRLGKAGLRRAQAKRA
jgi:ribosome biogenesis GTPase